MLLGLLDKLVFGACLLAALQLPQFADHYHQYLTGYFDSTSAQVAGYQATASRHHYASVIAMIDDHSNNENASVRSDAQQKRDTLRQHETLSAALRVFERGTLIQKWLFILRPSQADGLRRTLVNYRPGLPLDAEGLMVGVFAACVFYLFLYFCIRTPLRLLKYRKKLRTEH